MEYPLLGNCAKTTELVWTFDGLGLGLREISSSPEFMGKTIKFPPIILSTSKGYPALPWTKIVGHP